MSDVTSSTTLAELKSLYQANCSWEEDGSVAKAKTFVTVCKALLLQLPKQSGKGGASMSLNPELIEKEMERARAFIQANGSINGPSGTGSVIHPTFRNFRD